jgi:hypothetical protein
MVHSFGNYADWLRDSVAQHLSCWQEKGLVIPKNASRMEQSERKSDSPRHHINLLDAMDTQNIALPRQKELPVSSTVPGSVIDKPCMCSSLSSFDLFVIL